MEKLPDESITAFTIRRIRGETIDQCIQAIREHDGFSEDEKSIAIAVLHALQPSITIG